MTRGPGPAGAASPGRAVAGAAVSVSGVVLAIATLLWVTDAPASPARLADDRAASQAPPVAARGDEGAGEVVEAAEVPAGEVLAGEGPSGDVPVAEPGAGEAQREVPVAQPGAEEAQREQEQPGERQAGPTQQPARAAAPPAPSPVVPVTVLNNSRRDGLAARAAGRFVAAGWPVTATGNFRGRIPVTTVYYDPGLEASARAVAADVDGVVRVLPRFPRLPARGLVVVVTREFAV